MRRLMPGRPAFGKRRRSRLNAARLGGRYRLEAFGIKTKQEIRKLLKDGAA